MKDSDTHDTHVKPGSSLSKLLMKPAPPRREPDESEAQDAYAQAHAISREVLMLEIRLANGDIVSFPYSSLRKARYLRTGVIEMRFDDDLVVAEGRNLLPLHETIIRHQLRFIHEGAGIERGPNDEDAAHIERIEIRKFEEEI